MDDKNINSSQLKVNFRQRIITNQCVHIKRSLEGEGKLLVNFNEEVKPHDIIGKSVPTVGYTNINVAKELSVEPVEVPQFLERNLGASIFKGELLAYKKGLFNNKVVVAPTDCIIESFNPKTGEVKCKILTHEKSLTAGVYGIVEGIDKTRGEVLIKTMTTQIFGIIGSGTDRGGILAIAPGGGLSLIQANQIQDNMYGYILLGGALLYTEALKKALVVGISGIISGGIDFDSFASIIGSMEFHSKIGEDIGLSLLVTEGFGAIPIAEDIYSSLLNHEGKYVLISGNIPKLLLPSTDPDSILRLRKIALPHGHMVSVPAQSILEQVELGNKVRIIWPPYMGQIGQVVAIDQTVTVLESHIATVMLTIETKSRKLKVPYTNIEVIERD